MRRQNITTSQSYQSGLTSDGIDGSGGQMYKETITTGGRNSGGSQTIGEIKVHPEGHSFPPSNSNPATYEKPHYHGPKGEHISYDSGKPRSTHLYRPNTALQEGLGRVLVLADAAHSFVYQTPGKPRE